MADLDERGLAALAIKLGRYLDGLPDEMIEQADRLGFPLILLPNDVGFDDILNQVLTDILNRQAAILARTEEVHRALVQIVLCGGGLQEITDEVAALLGAAVAVIDGDGQELVASGGERHLAALRDEPSIGPPAEYGAHDDRTVVPVVAGGFTYGRMTRGAATPRPTSGCWSARPPSRRWSSPSSRPCRAVESKYRADFLRDVLTGRAGGGDEHVVAHSASFGWDLGRPVTVVVAELDQRPGGGTEDRVAAGPPGRRADLGGTPARPQGRGGRLLPRGRRRARRRRPATSRRSPRTPPTVFADAGRTFSAGVSRTADGARRPARRLRPGA